MRSAPQDLHQPNDQGVLTAVLYGRIAVLEKELQESSQAFEALKAELQKILQHSAGLDAKLEISLQHSAATEAKLEKSLQKSAATEAKLEKSLQKSAATEAELEKSQKKSAATEAKLEKSLQKSAATEVKLEKSLQKSVATEAELEKSQKKSAATEAKLEKSLQKSAATEAKLEKSLQKSAAQEEKLKALKQNSTNSSKPSSSDGPEVTKRKSKPTGKKRGGQPDHKGHHRELLPVEEVTSVEKLIPSHCECCNKELKGTDSKPLRHQVIEIPKIVPIVTEYQRHALECSCGHKTRAPLPLGVSPSAFGTELASLIALTTAVYRLSKRDTKEYISMILGIDVGLGSICGIEQQVAEALKAPVEEIHEEVKAAEVVHADETGWKEDKRKSWMWVACTPFGVFFMIAGGRGTEQAKELLGAQFSGLLAPFIVWSTGSRSPAPHPAAGVLEAAVQAEGSGMALGSVD